MNNIKNTKSNSEKKHVKDIKIFLKKKKKKKRKVRDRYKNLPGYSISHYYCFRIDLHY